MYPKVEEVLIEKSSLIESSCTRRRSSILEVVDLNVANVEAFASETSKQPSSLKKREANLGHRKFLAKHTESFPASLDFTKENKCVLAISMGSKHTQGARLDSMLQWAADNFDECTLMPGDYIYRLTMQLLNNDELTPLQAEQKAVEAIQDYQESISPIIAQYSQSCKFTWRPFSSIVKQYMSDFEELYQEMADLYNKNSSFRAAVQEFSHAYLERVNKDTSDRNAKAIALTYLLEECAIFAAMAKHEDPQLFVYSGKIGVMMDLIQGKFAGAPESLSTENIRFMSVIPNSRGAFFPKSKEKIISTVCPLLGATDFSTEDNTRQETALLDRFDSATKKKLLKYTKMKRFRPGQKLIDSGDSRKPLILIEKGRAEEFLVLGNDKNNIQRLRIVSSTVGDMSFLDGNAKSPVQVVALEEMEARTLSRKDFTNLLEQAPEVASLLLRELVAIQATRQRTIIQEIQYK